MFVPLNIVSEYSLLQSMIKLDDLIQFLQEHNFKACSLLDDNLCGLIAFYNKMVSHNLKPIIGFKITLDNNMLYLYAKNFKGYQNLLKINTLKELKQLTKENLNEHLSDLKIVLPFSSYQLLKEYPQAYLAYSTPREKHQAQNISHNIVYLNEARTLKKEDTIYLKYLLAIDKGVSLDEITQDFSSAYFKLDVLAEDSLTTIKFSEDLNVTIPTSKRYIPSYRKEGDSYEFLTSLATKGLLKRLHNEKKDNYFKRLNYELKVINDMGFVDYFLIVYDYVLYAKKNDILVGPGRGSAAGSLVSYSLGITDIDPLKYNLLFERFLNPERITMPDIDIDFEFTKRQQVIDYVREKYGPTNVAPIMTYGTLASKQVLRDVARVSQIDNDLVNKFVNLIEAKLSLKENFQTPVKNFLKTYPIFQNVYKVALKLEGLKRHISTHAAGVVISSIPLDEIIPVISNDNVLTTGTTMEYLEALGLLKMDFLALRNLTIISQVLTLIKNNTGKTINLNQINLEDPSIYALFSKGDTQGVFQFESEGMQNLMQKLKPTTFSDLIASVALFRPGPMQNIDLFIRRKYGREKIEYLHPDLEPILKETYGVIVYQEQVMQILVKIGNYSLAQADNIRRAMSKKKESIILQDKEHFLTGAISLGYDKSIAEEIYNLILKFANYGFNKAHSVSYALIGYQMAYLKVKFPVYFIANLLNMCIGSEIKTKEYLIEAKSKNIAIVKPDINLSTDTYQIINNSLVLPISTIKNIGQTVASAIILERTNNGQYCDYFDFITRLYKKLNRKNYQALIESGALDSFNLTKKTMLENLDIVLNYANLVSEIDAEFVEKPDLEIYAEYPKDVLRNQELASFGFYLTNHPVSIYQGPNITKLNQVATYFNKHIRCVVLVENIKTIKSKKGDNMAFLNCSDETTALDFVVFPSYYSNIVNLNVGDIIIVQGKVTKRFDQYQINIEKIEKKEGNINA